MDRYGLIVLVTQKPSISKNVYLLSTQNSTVSSWPGSGKTGDLLHKVYNKFHNLN